MTVVNTRTQAELNRQSLQDRMRGKSQKTLDKMSKKDLAVVPRQCRETKHFEAEIKRTEDAFAKKFPTHAPQHSVAHNPFAPRFLNVATGEVIGAKAYGKLTASDHGVCTSQSVVVSKRCVNCKGKGQYSFRYGGIVNSKDCKQCGATGTARVKQSVTVFTPASSPKVADGFIRF